MVIKNKRVCSGHKMMKCCINLAVRKSLESHSNKKHEKSWLEILILLYNNMKFCFWQQQIFFIWFSDWITDWLNSDNYRLQTLTFRRLLYS